MAAASERMAAANRDGRPAALVPMSDGGARDRALATRRARNERLRTLKPAPFSPDRMQVLPAVQAFLSKNPQADIVWIADGLARGQADAFAQGLAKARGRRARADRQGRPRCRSPSHRPTTPRAGSKRQHRARRYAQRAAAGVLRAYDKKGLAMGEARFDFGTALETKAQFDLPIELRNEIAARRNQRRTFRRRRQPARRALEAPPRRARRGLDVRCRAAAAVAALLSAPRLAALRRSARSAGGSRRSDPAAAR